MGVESVLVTEALSHPDTLDISWNFPTRVLLPALESMENKRQPSYRSYSTNVYIQNHWRTALKPLGKTARTQIILSPETPWTLYNYIYLEDNTAYGDKYWWHNWAHNKKQKTPKTWNTVIQYPTNRNPAQSLQENAITVFGPRLYNSLPKYLRDIESVKTEKFKFELDKFLELIPDEPKMPNYVTASGSNCILDQLIHLRALGIYWSGGIPDSAMEQP